MHRNKPSLPSRLYRNDLALTCILSLGALCLTGGRLFLWHQNGVPLVPKPEITVPVTLVAIILLLFLRTWKSPQSRLAPWHVAYPLVLLFLSGWMDSDYSLIRAPVMRGEIVLVGIACYLLLPHLKLTFVKSVAILLCGSLTLFSNFLWSGRLLSSDDHMTFIFRLKLLQEEFPSIPFYFPAWNGGMDARDFFATGALNLYLLASPFLAFFQVEQVYNLIVSLVLFVLVPISSAYASRLMSNSRSAPWLASLLAVSVSLLWYRWALKYGTMGCIVSCALFPLVTVLLMRAFNTKEEVASWTQVILTWFTTTLMLFWTPSGLAILPVLLLGAINLPTIFTHRKRLTLALLLLFSNLLWIPLFLKVSKVATFIEASQSGTDPENPGQPYHAQGTTFRHKREPFSTHAVFHRVKEVGGPSNPVVLFSGFIALLAMRSVFRRTMWICCFWLLSLTLVGPLLKPQLELDRMFLPLLFLLTLSAADSLGRTVDIYLRRPTPTLRGLLALCFSFLFTSVFCVFSILQSRTVEHYSLLDPEMERFSKAIRDSKQTGRVFFSGFVLHDFSGGHLAPFPLWTGKPVLAYSFAHNMWKAEQMIEEQFLRRGIEGVRSFLDLFNVGTVVAHEKEWIEYFRSFPGDFVEEETFGSFVVFQRKDHLGSYFLQGKGRILQQDYASVTFNLESSEAILKYTYFPFLTVSGCTLSPHQVSPKHSFIKLSGCPTDTPLVLQSVKPLERLFS